MNPHYIIDAYNLILNIPKFRNALEWNLERARNTLISFIRAYQSSKKIKITLVFDGDEVGYIERPPSTQRLKIIYSKPPQKADPVIKGLIRSAKNKKSLILVSGDNDLIQFSKHQGCLSLSPVEFYHRASKHPQQAEV